MNSIKLALLAAVVTGAWFIWPSNSVSSDAEAHMSAITEGLDHEFALRYLCINAGPFPYNTRTNPLVCSRCEDLTAAGLLERTRAPGSSDERPRWIYDLSPEADGVYTTDKDPVTGDKSPRFCFGRTRVHHLAAAQPKTFFGGNCRPA